MKYIYALGNFKKGKVFHSGNKKQMARLQFFYRNMKHLIEDPDTDWFFQILQVKEGENPRPIRLFKCPPHVKSEFRRITGKKKVYTKPYRLKPQKAS